MGIYVLINIDVSCDHCGAFVCTMTIAKCDVPAYKGTVVTCAVCKLAGKQHPSASTVKPGEVDLP